MKDKVYEFFTSSEKERLEVYNEVLKQIQIDQEFFLQLNKEAKNGKAQKNKKTDQEVY